jgi:hypothetical protein
MVKRDAIGYVGSRIDNVARMCRYCVVVMGSGLKFDLPEAILVGAGALYDRFAVVVDDDVIGRKSGGASCVAKLSDGDE